MADSLYLVHILTLEDKRLKLKEVKAINLGEYFTESNKLKFIRMSKKMNKLLVYTKSKDIDIL